MKIGIVGTGCAQLTKKIVEIASKQSKNMCDDCNFTFNKEYENKCPLCGCEVKH